MKYLCLPLLQHSSRQMMSVGDISALSSEPCPAIVVGIEVTARQLARHTFYIPVLHVILFSFFFVLLYLEA